MSKEKDYLKMVEGSANSWAGLPALVRQIKDDALTVLTNNLEDLFSSCDDLFFDLSSRAASNAEQNLYFESMRELRFKKGGVINAFKQNLEQYFVVLTRNAATANRNAATEAASAETLSLVQNDTLEQEVALTGMISKARVNCQEALYHLNTRFDYLIPRVSIDQDNNPLDPQQICRSFADACELFDINIKAKIIIFKQFDRLVASKLIKIYSAANELLINSGVLPKIAHTVQKHASTDAPADPGAAAADASAQLTAATQQLQLDFAELSNLLASMRRLGLTQLPNYAAYSSNPGPIMSALELATLLTQQQPHQSVGEPLEPVDIRQMVSMLLSSGNPNMPRALQQPDEDVINLVAMFFDFVLDDRNLPVNVQALISRLQIPILKVALKDKGFFSHANHPARKLINSIADASIGWDESEQATKDKLFSKVAEIVQDINEQYADNEQIFSEKLTELQQFVQQEEHRTSLVERRTSQAIEGQAKTQRAKTLVQELLFARLEKLELPPTISAFLVDQWQQLLVLIHLRHGEDSPEWLEAVQLVDDLIWASCRHEDAKSLQRLSKIKPELLQRVAVGLSKIAITAEASQSAIGAIGQVLDQLQTNMPLDFRIISAEQAVALGHTPGSGSKSWQEMTALERQQARYKALTYEFIKKADAMPIGTWVSYEDSRRGKIIRCKLAARIEVSDTFVFVNRFGFKVMEKARKDFAYDMQQHRATLLESGALFDRAMDSIVNNLRQIGKSNA